MVKYFAKKKLTLLFGDVLLIIASFYLSALIRWGVFVGIASSFRGALILSFFVYILTFYLSDLYNTENKLRSESYLIRFTTAVIIASSLIAAIFYVLPSWKYGRGIFLLNGSIIFIFSLSWRFLFDKFFKYKRKPAKLLILGAGHSGITLYKTLINNKDFEFVGFLDDDAEKWGTIFESTVIGGTSLLPSLIKDKKIDKVIVSITHEISPELIKHIVNAKFSGVEIYDMLTFYANNTGKVPVLHMSDKWLGDANIYGVKKNLYNIKIKRVLDEIIAVIGIVLSIPIILVTAILIKLDSKGPVFYRQERVGKDGKVFTLLKFRSMKANAEADGAVWAKQNDTRVTRVGKIIRLLRIDELPQMWNVIKGEMSFSGPRPERPEFVEILTENIPYYSLRHAVRPGITGWAQVNYRYGASQEDAFEKLQYDIFYIKNVSFILDIIILISTIRVVLFGRGAR